jgi:hypothetical protein
MRNMDYQTEHRRLRLSRSQPLMIFSRIWRNKMDNESADTKFRRIADEIVKNRKWRRLLAGEYADELRALDEIAKHYGGESWNTGGGIYVAVIPIGPHDALGVTGEVICHYHNSKAACVEDVFWDAENDTSEGCISLIETKCACGAAMVDGVCSDVECRFNVRE